MKLLIITRLSSSAAAPGKTPSSPAKAPTPKATTSPSSPAPAPAPKALPKEPAESSGLQSPVTPTSSAAPTPGTIPPPTTKSKLYRHHHPDIVHTHSSKAGILRPQRCRFGKSSSKIKIKNQNQKSHGPPHHPRPPLPPLLRTNSPTNSGSSPNADAANLPLRQNHLGRRRHDPDTALAANVGRPELSHHHLLWHGSRPLPPLPPRRDQVRAKYNISHRLCLRHHRPPNPQRPLRRHPRHRTSAFESPRRPPPSGSAMASSATASNNSQDRQVDRPRHPHRPCPTKVPNLLPAIDVLSPSLLPRRLRPPPSPRPSSPASPSSPTTRTCRRSLHRRGGKRPDLGQNRRRRHPCAAMIGMANACETVAAMGVSAASSLPDRFASTMVDQIESLYLCSQNDVCHARNSIHRRGFRRNPCSAPANPSTGQVTPAWSVRASPPASTWRSPPAARRGIAASRFPLQLTGPGVQRWSPTCPPRKHSSHKQSPSTSPTRDFFGRPRRPHPRRSSRHPSPRLFPHRPRPPHGATTEWLLLNKTHAEATAMCRHHSATHLPPEIVVDVPAAAQITARPPAALHRRSHMALHLFLLFRLPGD